MSFFENIWNTKQDWELSGDTWIKITNFRLLDKDNNNSIIDIDDIYWKYEKCLSGVTYQYVISSPIDEKNNN